MSTTESYKPAGILSRVSAVILDSLIVGLPTAMVVFLLGGEVLSGVGTLAFSAVFALYEIFMIARNGQTIGKRLVAVRIVADPGSPAPPSLKLSALRYVLKTGEALYVLLLVGVAEGTIDTVTGFYVLAVVISILVSGNKRGIHDHGAGTYAVTLDRSPGATAGPTPEEEDPEPAV